MSIMAVRMCFFCVVLNTLYHNTSHRLSIITVKQFVMSDCCSSPISDCIHGFFFRNRNCRQIIPLLHFMMKSLASYIM